MKALYFWDNQNHFDHSTLYEELPTTLPENATSVAPENGLYGQLTWDGKVWTGVDKETWLADNPLPDPEPSAQDEATATILLKIAQNKKEQDKFNAQIMLTLAQKGGNN